MQRHPELRWIASLLVLAAAAAAAVTAVSDEFRDKAVLPATSPDQLVSKVITPQSTEYSGAILAHVDLGLPTPVRLAIAQLLPIGGNLLGGTHTMRYWYGGAQRQRVAVVEPTAEQDVFRNGAHVLLWDTRSRVATRMTLPSRDARLLPMDLATPAALSPPQLAARILALAHASSTTSDTTLRSGERIANRSTYELVVRPDDARSLVDAVYIDVDGRTSVPLSVQVYARGAVRPAVDIAFTTISFTPPAGRNFTFTPPSDSRSALGTGAALSQDLPRMQTSGSGWLSISSYPVDAALGALLDGVMGDSARSVHGSWGHGRLLQTPLLSLLVTSSGETVAGAVEPAVLYAGLSR